MIDIDGSQGEGGGQILRSSLALSMATGKPFHIGNIRAGRERPGLMRQHLTCVQAAAAICGAAVDGAAVGSQEVSFVPGRVRAGEYRFAIGTAGGTTLVLQAVLPALLVADGPSTIVVEGGTHNRAAPPFEFFDRALIPMLNRTGAMVSSRLERCGFYPAGGGRVVVQVSPSPEHHALHLPERGQRLGARAIAMVSRLPRSVAHRELQTLRERLGLELHQTELIEIDHPIGPGNAAAVELQYEHITEVFSAVGEIGKSAELVARELADEVRTYYAAQKPVGPYLADQLMVPLAVLSGGRYATGPLTEHARTNIDVVGKFGGRIDFEDEGLVTVHALRKP